MLDYYLFFPYICLYHFNVCLLFYQKPKDKTKDYQKKKDLKNKEREDVLAFTYVRVCVSMFMECKLHTALYQGQGNVQSNGYCNVFLCF